jgi:hypothetical protein
MAGVPFPLRRTSYAERSGITINQKIDTGDQSSQLGQHQHQSIELAETLNLAVGHLDEMSAIRTGSLPSVLNWREQGELFTESRALHDRSTEYICVEEQTETHVGHHLTINHPRLSNIEYKRFW